MHTREYYQVLTEENEKKVLAAERTRSLVVNALPLRYTFEFTGDCNLRCPMCEFNRERTRIRSAGRTDLSAPVEYFRMVARTAFPAARTVNPTVVGEPLLIPFLDELADTLYGYATQMEIITNGLLMDESMISRLLPVLSKATISFDGATRETFERIRRGADFHRIVNNIRALCRMREEQKGSRRIEVVLGVTLMRENIEELPGIISLAAELGVDSICTSNLIIFEERLRFQSLLYHREIANEYFERARSRARELGIHAAVPKPFPLHMDIPPRGGKERAPLEEGTGSAKEPFHTGGPQEPPFERKGAPAGNRGGMECKKPFLQGETRLFPGNDEPPSRPISCPSLWREVFVAFNGDVAPCCAQGRPVMGNIHKEDFMEIWNSPLYQEMRRRIDTKNPFPCCRRCPLHSELGNEEYQAGSYLVLDEENSRKRREEE